MISAVLILFDALLVGGLLCLLPASPAAALQRLQWHGLLLLFSLLVAALLPLPASRPPGLVAAAVAAVLVELVLLRSFRAAALRAAPGASAQEGGTPSERPGFLLAGGAFLAGLALFLVPAAALPPLGRATLQTALGLALAGSWILTRRAVPSWVAALVVLHGFLPAACLLPGAGWPSLALLVAGQAASLLSARTSLRTEIMA